MENRKQKERDFHNSRVEASQTDAQAYSRLTSNKKFYTVSRGSRNFIRRWVAERCGSKRVLDFCCGTGDFTCFLAGHSAETVGIDISDKSISACRERAVKENVADKASFMVMDAEKLDFEDASFDAITCMGVLHHLDIEKAFAELSRVLKPGGEIICGEPLAYNPVIQLYRKLTPHLRTEWEAEHILTRRAIMASQRYFGGIKTRFFNLVTLAAVPLRNTPAFGPVLSVCEAVDAVLLRTPLLKWLAWQVVFILSEPKVRTGK